MQKKQVTLVIVSLLVVVLSVSLAYFTAQIIGKGKDVSVSSADLKIIFTDTDGNIEGNDITPGWSNSKTFTVKNESNRTYKYDIIIKDLVNTFVTEGYLQYKITSTNNGYNMTDYVSVPKSSTATDTILAKNISIAVNVTQKYTIEFRYVNDENVNQSDDIYWRIIRTNSDGSIRLLYHGTSTTATDAYIGESVFNTANNNPMYVGYMYGTSGSLANNRTNTNNSIIKGTIDTWYKDNLNINYGKYISTTAIYCNDRSNPTGGYNTGKSTFLYGASTRLDTNKTPTYDCTNVNDKFTVDTSTGNGKLTYPIALMTADEVSFAGGVYAKGTKAWSWYNYNSANGRSAGTSWWLLSPFYWDNSYAYVFNVQASSNSFGYLNGSTTGLTDRVRPVISLKSCVKISGGDGSASDPYTIRETTSGC